ncbi:methyl-accepting chemotaxis protein [Marinococcus sp. PL1-022]|uniref:methyl-accepting chemotaxis protein n=1 Tax=Marinococcus sp. PL1-022 TaxID=3095363 RepID=UPI0029C14D0B|nr:methyl-accepting chemotaxis protein [Marinococcus sp. PL1-022]MDX6151898.1 methyl-accepting chemotaxis protein [Marinococcus sp. PL1-022]
MKEWFNFKSLRAKILTGFLAVIALVTALGVYNFYANSKANAETENIVEEQLPLLIADEKLAFNMAQRVALSRGYVLFGDEEFKSSFMEYTEESAALEEKTLADFGSDELGGLIEQSVAWEQIITTEVFPAYEAGNEEEAKQILNTEAKPLAREIMSGFEDTAAEREGEITAAGENVLESGRNLMTTGTIVSILVIIAGVAIAFFMARTISAPIRAVMQRMQSIAEGDLSQEPMQTTARDETGKLVQAANQMNVNMARLLTQIKTMSTNVSDQSQHLTHSANEVKAGSQQVAVTMEELASGAESQATSASSIASLMSDFTENVSVAHTKGEDVRSASTHILSITNEGRELMDNSVHQMEKIDAIVKNAAVKVEGLDKQSQEISKLVSVINDIANQTNLLALNAAIEAARAGEQGRGFAVVADEVRKLAEQVSASITDITSIVEGIQNESSSVTASLQAGYKEVETGTTQIQTTGETFNTINTAIQEMAGNLQAVTQNLAAISSSSQEINASIEEIASVSEESAAGVEQTAASVQQTSSSMEEVSANSENLNDLARQLNAEVAKFKL